MKLRDVLSGIPLAGGSLSPEMEIFSISWDSRTVRPGALFAALPGKQDDGGAHIQEALERGAAAVLCAEPGPGPRLVAEEPRKAFGEACANWFGRPGDRMTLAAVTGTNGKTTTTSLLKELLEGALGVKAGLIGTNRNLIGDLELPASRTTPDSYTLQALLRRMADAGCTHVVMEASSHALVQRRTAGLTFDAAVFTNLTQDHLDYHRTMEEYRAAKGLLFGQSRTAVLNLDDEAGRWYRERVKCPVFTYSERDAGADLTARNLRLFPDRVEFEALMTGKLSHAVLPIPGGFSVYNALAALAAGVSLGVPLEKLARVMPRVHGVKGRVEVVPVPADYTVVIDYAHSPNALENILTTARDFTRNRLICVFGCGGDRDRSKRPLMGAVAGELADVAVVTSDNPRTEDPQAIITDILTGMGESQAEIHVEPDRRAAIARALSAGEPGDVIVLAGKGHETYQEIGTGRFPLDEREVVAGFFRRQERTGNLPAGVV